jgi:two-component system, cell cycle response regulator DivK
VPAPLVLIVDDSEDGRTICAEYLEFRGFRAALAEDGQQALDFVHDRLPDVIVMDLAMPVLGGLEAARRLRNDPRTRQIPLIALTAYATRDARADALAAGFDAVLTKPCPPAALEQEIRRILEI